MTVEPLPPLPPIPPHVHKHNGDYKHLRGWILGAAGVICTALLGQYFLTVQWRGEVNTRLAIIEDHQISTKEVLGGLEAKYFTRPEAKLAVMELTEDIKNKIANDIEIFDDRIDLHDDQIKHIYERLE